MADTALPIHPVTGLRALGLGKRGPIWPVIGGNGEGGDPPTDPNPPTDPPADPPSDPPADADPKPGDDDKLGEGGKKALDAERERAKALDKELKALKAAQQKAERAKLDDTERAKAEAADAADRADKAERRAALLEAAVKHKLDSDDLELLEDTPVDKIDARAKKLAALRKESSKPGSSGGEATGNKGPQKPTSLSGAIAAHYNTP